MMWFVYTQIELADRLRVRVPADLVTLQRQVNCFMLNGCRCKLLAVFAPLLSCAIPAWSSALIYLLAIVQSQCPESIHHTMLTALQQQCHLLALAGWSPVQLAAAAAAGPALQQLWGQAASSIHTSSSCCQEQHSALARSSGEASTSGSSSSLLQPITAKAAAHRSKQQTQRLQAIVRQNMAEVPQAARTGDRALLTQQQRESMALFRRFNISQPGLRGQVILAKVLRSTPKYLLVDPGYYGLNVVARQVGCETLALCVGGGRA